MSDEDYEALLRSSDEHFRNVLVFLRYTGARPCEMRGAKWEHVDFEQSVIGCKAGRGVNTAPAPLQRIGDHLAPVRQSLAAHLRPRCPGARKRAAACSLATNWGRIVLSATVRPSWVSCTW